MADQHNDNVPGIANSVAGDIADIKENLEFHKDVAQTITGGWSNTATTHIMVGNAGDFNRSKIVSASDTTLTLTAAKYHHAGTTDQMVYWADTTTGITFTVGSGGSNSASDDLGADEWHYIYLDNSAIATAGTNIISNSELLNDTTGPTWNGAKFGWYSGLDRCIGAFYSDADSDILEFFHDGGDYVLFADRIGTRSLADLDTSWVDVDMTGAVPAFATRAECSFRGNAAGNANTAIASWRTKDQTGSTGHIVGVTDADNSEHSFNAVTVISNSSQVIEVQMSISGAHQLGIKNNGYYLPQGI